MPGLFDPINLGELALSNRVIMAPLTRMKAFTDRIPGPLMLDYYVQRANAGLIISEATSISPQGVGYPNTPGIWSDEQIAGWARITAGVHAAGGKMVLQLWHVGRVSDPVYLEGALPVAPSAIAPQGHVATLRPYKPYVVPRVLETHEIPAIVDDFRQAAANAKRAGFDGVEIHAANGYLLDQFLHDNSNQRTDRYGGSIENRARFLLDVVDAILTVWPAGRIGVHLNLMSNTHSMHDTNPAALFTHVAQQLNARQLAFIFGREDVSAATLYGPLLRQHFHGAYIANDGLTKASAQALLAAGTADAVSFGRWYIANPDLVKRLRFNAPLNSLDPQTLYSRDRTGYTDYPALDAANG